MCAYDCCGDVGLHTDYDAIINSYRTNCMWYSDDVVYDESEKIWHGNDYGNYHWCVFVDYRHGILASNIRFGLWSDY